MIVDDLPTKHCFGSSEMLDPGIEENIEELIPKFMLMNRNVG